MIRIFYFIFFLLFSTGILAQSKVDLLHEQADSLLLEGKIEKALILLDKILILAPDNSKAYENRGIVLSQLGDTAMALLNLDLAIKYNPKNSSAFRNRGVLIGHTKKYDLALKDLNQAVKLDPDNARYYAIRAGIKSTMHLYKECMIDFDKAIQLEPLIDTAYVWKAQAIMYELDDANQAVAVLDECIKKCPKSVYALEIRVVYNIQREKYQDIINDIETLINLAGEHPNYYYARGMAKERLGDKIGACTDMNLSREKGSQDAMLYVVQNCVELINTTQVKALALVYEADQLNKRKMYSSAISKLNDAILLDPTNSAYYYQRARNKFIIELYSESIKDLNLALKLNPNDGWSLLMYGQCLMYLEDQSTKDFTKAKEYMKKAVDANPNEVQFYWYLAMLYLDTEDPQSAIPYLKIALELSPSTSDLLMLMGEAHLQLKEKENACTYFQKANTLGNSKAPNMISLHCK